MCNTSNLKLLRETNDDFHFLMKQPRSQALTEFQGPIQSNREVK